MGQAVYTTPGSYTFVVPPFATVQVQVWGGGGGGGGGNGYCRCIRYDPCQGGCTGNWDGTDRYSYDAGGGADAGYSYFNAPSGNVVGYGGGGGSAGIGGTGGSTGAAGSAVNGDGNYPGSGAGGGGGGAVGSGGSLGNGGNGGAGGYAIKTYYPGQLGVGSGISVVVGGAGGPGAGGSGQSVVGSSCPTCGANFTSDGSYGTWGGNGQVVINWTDPPPQPVAVDPVSPAYTYFLTHGENTFALDSTRRHTVNLNAGAWPADGAGRIGYRSIYVPPGGSVSLDYSGDFAYGTGDFTIEAWVYFTGFSNNGYQQILYEGRSNDANGIYLGIVWNGSANVIQYYQSGGRINSGNIAIGWHHIALVRAQGYSLLFIDGASQAGLYTDTFNIVAHTPTIASVGAGLPAIYIDEYRISRAARYVANFTPYTTPFPPYAFDATPLATSSPVLSAAPLGLPGLSHQDAYTVLLMHFEGPPLSTLIADMSGKNHVVTSNGGARINTAPVAKFGVGLGEFSGVPACYLSLDSSADFAFGTGDFTIEMWCSLAVLPSTAGVTYILYDGRDATATISPGLAISTGNTIYVYYDSAIAVSGTVVLTAGLWYHIVAVRASGVTKLYVNGTQDGPSYTDTNNYVIGPGGLPRIGGNGSLGLGFNGYIDEVRVSRVARWTTNFLVPVAPYPPYQLVAQSFSTASPFVGNAGPLQSMDGNTVLLLHCDGFNGSTVVPDTSGRNHPITPNGTAKLATAQEKFGSASANFDGSASCYLFADGSNDFAFGTGDFTVDLWFYLNVVSTQVLYDGRPIGAEAITPTIYINGSVLSLYQNGGNVISGTTTLMPGVWHHGAVARASGTTKLFLNGVQEGVSYADTNNYVVAASCPVIGAISGGSQSRGSFGVNGYLDEIRVSKGVARWTANFSPPTSPYSYLFYPTNLTTASPHFSPVGLGGSMSAFDLETSSPTFTAPALKSFWAIPAALNLVTGSPFIGLGYPIGVLHASALVTGSPDFKVDPVLQQHPQILHADDLVPEAPDLGKPGRLPQAPVVYPDDMDRHVRRTGDDYAQALIDLLPRGQAWPRDPGSTMIRSLVGLAEFYGYVDGRAADLLERESDPRATLELLPDWERNWGLPDPCFKETTTIGERRDMLVMKMTLLGGQSRLFFYSVAAWMGYQITIEEYSPFMVGISQVGDTSALSQDHVSPRWQIGRPEMRFYWTIHVTNASLNWFRASQGQAGVDPHLRIGLFIDQDCLFNRWKPAHTEIVYDYSNLKPGHSMDGTP